MTIRAIDARLGGTQVTLSRVALSTFYRVSQIPMPYLYSGQKGYENPDVLQISEKKKKKL